MTDTPPTQTTQPIPDRDFVTPDVVARGDPFPWWLSAVLGVVSIGFGIVVLIWPGETLRVMAACFGVWLILAGFARVVGAFMSGTGIGAQMLSGVVGVLLILGGVACLRNLVTAVAVLATLVAAMWLLSGLSELVIAFTVHGPSRGWLIALGVVSILTGLVFAIWPELSLATLVLTTCVGALVIGVGQVAFALQIRRLSR
jgi:uncharacterized membrane protein HdeD (DUF308 family)